MLDIQTKYLTTCEITEGVNEEVNKYDFDYVFTQQMKNESRED